MWLLTDDAVAAHFLDLAVCIGNYPMPTDELCSDVTIIGNGNRLRKHVTVRVGSGLLIDESQLQQQLVQIEFKQFFNTFIHVPCQILPGARRLTYRITNFTFDTLIFYDIFQHLQKLRFS